MGEQLLGCIEAGGTKFVCGLSRGGKLLPDRARFETRDPAATLGAVRAWFARAEARHGGIDAFGIGSFGPIDRDPRSRAWGSIRNTPKPGWSNISIVDAIREAFPVPIGFDTDVNAAAMAEASIGRHSGIVVYITVGTGIGGGIVADGVPLDGLCHPEMGHFYPPRHPADLAFAGRCPFHGACLEGLASGPAIIDRWGKPLSQLPADHEALDIIAFYLAHLAIGLIATLSPHRIAFGGGVMNTPGLIERIRAQSGALHAGYQFDAGQLAATIDKTGLGDNAGLLGAMLLAQRAWAAINPY